MKVTNIDNDLLYLLKKSMHEKVLLKEENARLTKRIKQLEIRLAKLATKKNVKKTKTLSAPARIMKGPKKLGRFTITPAKPIAKETFQTFQNRLEKGFGERSKMNLNTLKSKVGQSNSGTYNPPRRY